MKKVMYQFMAVAALLLLPALASAQSADLTVANGSGTNEYIPVYGYYVDEAQHNQIVYPADSLEDMFSGSITAMTFYMSQVSTADWGITATVSIATTSATNASELDETTELTQVWQGSWSGLESEFTIEFDEPFVYDGDNLLVDIVTTSGSWKRAYFYGATATNGSICTYNSYYGTSSYPQNFLPKTKFDYTVGGAAICRKPKNITFTEYTNQGVTVSWTAPIDGPSDYAVLIDGEVVATTTDTFAVLTGLDANTQYNVQVKHVCGDGDSSSALSGSFRTLCQNGNCDLKFQISGSYYYAGTANVYQNSALLSSITFDYYTSEASVEICSGDSVIVIYQAPSNNFSAATWNVIDAGESVIATFDNSHATGDTVVAVASGCPSCMPVNALYYVATSSYSATVHWTDNNVAGLGDYVVIVNGTPDYVSLDTTYTFATTPKTHYDVTVARICEEGDTSHSRQVSFTTPCDDNSYEPLPFSSGFEELETGESPDCWIQVQTGSSGVNTIFPSAYRWASNAHNSNVYFEFESANQETEVLALPRMENISNLQLSFYASTITSTSGFTLEAGVVEIDDNGEYVFVPVDTIDLIAGSSFASSYHIYNVLFDTYTGDGERLALRTVATGTAQYTLMIDDFSVIYAGSPVLGPFSPISHTISTDSNLVLHANLMSGDGVTYTWTSEMIANGTASIVDQDSNSVTLNYTEGGIDTVFVIASTGFGEPDTESVIIYIVDLSPVSEFPYTTGFEDGDDLSWHTANNSNGWFLGTATSYEGERSYYISRDNGATNSIADGINAKSFLYRHVHFDEPSEYTLSFNWKNAIPLNHGYLRVYLASGIVNPTAGSSVYSYTAISENLGAQSEWQTFGSAFTVDSGDYTLIFYWDNTSYSTSSAPAAVDNVNISVNTCPAVTNLTASSVSGHQATISWQPLGSESEWIIRVNDGEDSLVYGSSMLLTGLASETNYTVSVRALCGEGDTSFAKSVSFTTTVACPPVSNIHVSDITESSATIAWTAGGTETAWRIVIGDGDTIDVADTTYTATSLDANTVYNVTILANCGEDDGTSTTASTTFRTMCEGGSCIFNVTMADTYGDGWNGSSINVFQSGTTFETLTIATGNNNTVTVSPCLGEPVTLVWHAGSYTYEASFTIKNADDSVLMSISNCSNLSEGDTLVVFDGNCNATVYDIHEPITPGSCPDPTALTATATETTIDFSFSGTATDYDVEILEGNYTVYTWPGFTENAVRITTTSHTFTGLEPGTEYTIGVRAVCDEEAFEYSNVVVVSATTEEHIVENCDAPVDVDVPEATTDSTFAIVHWTESGSATMWQISLKRGSDEQLFTTSNNPYTVSGLTPGSTYYVKVRALCSATDTSAWSQSAAFQTPQGGTNPGGDTTGIAAVDELAVSLYPNPASDYATLEVAEPAEVTLVDLNGRTVYAARTEGTLRIELSQLGRGTYFVRIVSESGLALRKLVVK